VIDIRTAEEVTAQPAPARHIAMPMLLANPDILSRAGRYVLVCASGRRSLAAARELHERGFDVQSLAGGLQSLNG
jgi:rhodanese-related sulfurtransferase